MAPAPKWGGAHGRRQRRFDLRERGAAASGEHEFGRIVVHDAGMRPRVERGAPGRASTTEKTLRIAAANQEWRAGIERGAHLVLQEPRTVSIGQRTVDGGLRRHQKRSRSGCGN